VDDAVANAATAAHRRAPVTNIRNVVASLAWMVDAGKPVPCPGKQFRRIRAGAEP
jgi:hypothetical protein